VNSNPDPVEIAADELRRLFELKECDTLAHVDRLTEALPDSRRLWGGIRLLSDHMANTFQRDSVVRLSPYGSFDPSHVDLAAQDVLATIQPKPGMELPVFRDDSPRYTLDYLIAYGGFGSAWSATPTFEGTRVAIKTTWTPARLTSDWQQRVELLSHEGEVLARLSHPGIVNLVEVLLDAGGIAYPVLEALDGGTIAAQSRPVELHQAVRWGAEIAEALDYLRRRAIVHRDIAPTNVALDSGGSTRIIDFGLALGTEERLEYDGQRAGTPGFMPPEQMFGTSRELGCRSDATSVGAILYELITGTPLHDDNSREGTIVAWMAKQLQERAEDERVPQALRPILRRCFAYHQEDRFPTAGQLAKELRSIIGLSPLHAWWAGRSAATAAGYAARTESALSELRDIPANQLDPNTIMMTLLQGVGVIEEIDRLERLLSSIHVESPVSSRRLDPRRRLRTPVQPDEFPVIDSGLRELIQEGERAIDLARHTSENGGRRAGKLFELARTVHLTACREAPPDNAESLTADVDFPEQLMSDLRGACKNGPHPAAIARAIAAFDAHAERVLA
jgi:serine/threonine protein kinase